MKRELDQRIGMARNALAELEKQGINLTREEQSLRDAENEYKQKIVCCFAVPVRIVG